MPIDFRRRSHRDVPDADQGGRGRSRAHEVDASTIVFASPDRVLRAFFDRDALKSWWRATDVIVTPRVLGPYVLEWPPSLEGDNVLGRRGGVFRGTVVQYAASGSFFVADAFWIPPDSDPIGPMALEVTCTPDTARPNVTLVRVLQTGFEESERWHRYYEVIGGSWPRALARLKAFVEG